MLHADAQRRMRTPRIITLFSVIITLNNAIITLLLMRATQYRAIITLFTHLQHVIITSYRATQRDDHVICGSI